MDDHVDIDDLVVAASDEARRLENPIRRIVEDRKMSANPSKELLNLSVGTPLLSVGPYIIYGRA